MVVADGEQMAVDVGAGSCEQVLTVCWPEPTGDVVDADAFAGAQPGHHHVVEAVVGGELFALLGGQLAALDEADVALHVADVP